MDVDLDHPAIAGYLARLEAAAVHLPQWRRDELVAEIRSHLNEALLSAADHDDAAVYAAVDRLGDPADIVAAEGAPPAPAAQPAPTAAQGFGTPEPPYGAVPPTGWQPGPPAAPVRGLGAGWGPVELIAVIGLALSVFTAGLGLVVGLVCTWISDRWTIREKVVATLLSLLVVVGLILPVLGLMAARSGPVRQPQPVVSVVPAPTEVTP